MEERQMKRIMTILIVASLFGGVAFARGASELDSNGTGNGPGNFGRDTYAQGNFNRGSGLNSQDTFGRGVNRAQGSALVDGVSFATDGTIEMIDDHYILKTAEGAYSVSAPGFPRSGAPMPLGESVQVSGLLLPTAVEDCPVDAEGHIIIETAVFGDEEFEFEAGSAGGRNRSGRQYAGRSKGTTGRRR
jgi:hypothetical protein